MKTVRWDFDITFNDCWCSEFEVELDLASDPDQPEEWYISSLRVIGYRTKTKGDKGFQTLEIEEDQNGWRGWLASQLLTDASDGKTELNAYIEEAWAAYCQECMA